MRAAITFGMTVLAGAGLFAAGCASTYEPCTSASPTTYQDSAADSPTIYDIARQSANTAVEGRSLLEPQTPPDTGAQASPTPAGNAAEAAPTPAPRRPCGWR